MKKLVLIRHAKSAWDNPYLSDHQRPLAERGLRDIPRMGQRLKKRGVYPDMMLSSDAERAKITAQIIAEQLDFPKESIHFTRELYHADASEILEYLRNIPVAIGVLFIFGHNPGLNDLIWELGGQIDNLPTSGQYGFTFQTTNWRDIERANATIWFDDYPEKDI